MLNTTVGTIQAINRSGVYIIPFIKDNKDFTYIALTMGKCRDIIKEYEADHWLNRYCIALARVEQT